MIPRIGILVDNLVYLREEGILSLAMAEEHVGKIGRGGFLFHTIRVLIMADMGKLLGE